MRQSAAISPRGNRNTHPPKPTPTPVPTPTPTPTPPTSGSLYFGAYTADSYDLPLTDTTAFETLAGKDLAIAMWYQGWGVSDSSKNFEPVWMTNVRNAGSIPMITWEPYLYTSGVDQSAFTLESIIDGSHDAYITEFAEAAKAWGHPFFLRFAHEMNGNWYPWCEGQNGNTTGQYVQAWIHVHNIFTSAGATNVSWVWCPNVSYSGSLNMANLYPGDEYVDWLGLDGYNWGTNEGNTWQTFTQVFSQSYAEITTISDKPLLICETSSAEQGGSKAAWITDALTSAIYTMPRIEGFIWFNQDQSPTDWLINSSSTAVAAFKTAIGSSNYLSNIYGSIVVAPLP